MLCLTSAQGFYKEMNKLRTLYRALRMEGALTKVLAHLFTSSLTCQVCETLEEIAEAEDDPAKSELLAAAKQLSDK